MRPTPLPLTARTLYAELNQQVAQRQSNPAHLNQLRAEFIAAGGTPIDEAPMRTLSALADGGALNPATGFAQLIGSFAFQALANPLGVRWAGQLQTQAIDLAVIAPQAPTTPFQTSGQEIGVKLFTPMRGSASAQPVFVPSINALAQPVRFLDYLLESPIAVVLPGRESQILLNVPTPERFALHKLLLSESRPAASAPKAENDRLQAGQILQVLLEEAPDGVAEARVDLLSRGKDWEEKLQKALEKCRKPFPGVVEWIESIQ